MVPRFPFPPGAPPAAVDANGFLDTFYPCRAAGSALVVTGPPAGVVSMGGYRFILAGLQEAVSQLEPGAMVAAFPDGLAGQRVAGIAVHRDAIRDALAELGFNPLVVNAFGRAAAARPATPREFIKPARLRAGVRGRQRPSRRPHRTQLFARVASAGSLLTSR